MRALNDGSHVAPQAVPVCGRIAAMTSIEDMADRPPRVLADEETLTLGNHVVEWLDTPHLPHAWECGLMIEQSTRTFLCGDLFTQNGTGAVPLTESDILGPSEPAPRWTTTRTLEHARDDRTTRRESAAHPRRHARQRVARRRQSFTARARR